MDGKELSAQGMTVVHSFGQYQLILPAETWVDVEIGGACLDAAEGALKLGALHRVLGPAYVTATIARRPFLPGDDGEWVESQRRKLKRQLLRALHCLAQMWIATQEAPLAVEAGTEAVCLDLYNEFSYQLLMRAYDAIGNRAEAVNTYHQLHDILSEDLGIDPSAETEALYMDLLR